jgi:aerobic C4-dicarboxylate transport protein
LGIFPVAGVALLLGADRLMDSMRVVVNLLGNCVATFVVAKWEGQFDRAAMLRAFAGETTTAGAALEPAEAAVPDGLAVGSAVEKSPAAISPAR